MGTGKFLPENRSKRVQQLRQAEYAPVAGAPQPLGTPPEPEKKKRKGPRISTIVFYTFYLLLIGASAWGIHYGLGLLNDWLVVYEASQPDTRSQEIFNELFAQPDWGEIYDLAGMEDTKFEGKGSYVAYMEQLVGDRQLTFSKTSAGLSGGEKYIVRVGDIKVATFTMENPVTGETEIPKWSLSGVEADFFSRDLDVTVLTQPGRTVTVNGVVLDDSYVIKTTTSLVDSYLPEGVYGPKTATLYAKGFLVPPLVQVLDETGAPVEMLYDAVTGTYMEMQMGNPTEEEIPDEEYQALLTATVAYSKAMIGADKNSWKKHFVSSSPIYKQIQGLVNGNAFFKGWSRYQFEKETITEYHRYTDNLFSARIKMTLNTYRRDGSVKPFELDTTVFMEKNGNKWLVTQLVNSQVHGILTQVRLTWTDAEGNVLESGMVDATSDFLTPPVPEAPEGMVFAGWFQEIIDDQGNRTLKLIFAPTEDGTISLPEDYMLEPMVLIARFEKQGA